MLNNDSKTKKKTATEGLQKQIQARKLTKALHAQAATYAVWTENEHVFGLIRMSPRGRLLVLANFSEQIQQVKVGRMLALGFGGPLVNHLDRNAVNGSQDVTLAAYQAVWLQKEPGS